MLLLEIRAIPSSSKATGSLRCSVMTRALKTPEVKDPSIVTTYYENRHAVQSSLVIF